LTRLHHSPLAPHIPLATSAASDPLAFAVPNTEEIRIIEIKITKIRIKETKTPVPEAASVVKRPISQPNNRSW
jgi:hypothetical protein